LTWTNDRYGKLNGER